MMENEDDNLDKLIFSLRDKENFWNETIEKLSARLNCSVKDVISLQADVISLRQKISEEIKYRSYQLYKLMPIIKLKKKQRFEYYASAMAPYPNNATERTKLIEWDLALYDQRKDFMDNHVEFLRECMKNIDNMNYAIKNKISLYQLTDLE